MPTVDDMMTTTPNAALANKKALADCVKTCLACGFACSACADACLGEDDVEVLRRCIRLNLDCADLCLTSARILARVLDADMELIRPLVTACSRACGTCADECERHAQHHEHCKVCAEECRRCEQSCQALLAS